MAGSPEETVRAFYERWNGGDDLDGLFAELLADDVEWHTLPELPDATVHRGRDEVERMLRDLIATMGRFNTRIDSLEVLGGRVLTELTLTGTGSSSSLPMEVSVAHIHDVTDGRIDAVRAFFTLDAARSAL
jgi:ketosteroid isomerase-like protein